MIGGHFRGPYAFGSQQGEPWRGPYTFGETPVGTAPSLVNDAPVGRSVGFSIANGDPPFVVNYKDGVREGQPARIFSHTFLSAGTFLVEAIDARGRTSTNSVTVA